MLALLRTITLKTVILVSLYSQIYTMEINYTETCYPGCECMLERMNCSLIIPITIPHNVTMVTVTGVPQFTYLEGNSPFMDVSWKNVSLLSITCNETAYVQINDNVFRNCGNLKHLIFTANVMQDIRINGFVGLDKLETLELKDCFQLWLSTLIPPLNQTNVLSKLKKLRLESLDILGSEAPYFSEEFFSALKEKNIEQLDLTGMASATMEPFSFSKNLPNLKSLNFQASSQLSVHMLMAYFFNSKGATFKHLESMNVNFAHISESLLQKSKFINLVNRFVISTLEVLAISELRVKRVVPSGERVKIELYQYEDRACIVLFLMDISLKIPTICARTLDKYFSRPTIRVIDLAENGIVNIDVALYPYFRQTRFINCSFNNLTSTDWIIPEEIDNNTKAADLEELHCSHNLIDKLYSTIKTLVPNITIIDMSYNLLQTIPANITKLIYLKMLDVRYNNILFLDSQTTSMFNKLIKTDSTEEQINDFQLKLGGNPLQCKCDDAHMNFINWLRTTQIIQSPDKKRLTCSYTDTNFAIDAAVLNKITTLCDMPKFIALSVGSGILLISILLVFSLRVVRYKRKRNRILRLEKLIQNYKTNLNNDRFAVFLSYSSTDAEFVIDNIFTNLNTNLKNILDTNKTCVATGDFNFRLGYPITNEIISCVDASAVVVFCVSSEFCKSRWCEDEVIVACFDKKPILLMFLEKVDIKEMPKVLTKPFQKITRAKWIVNKNGEKELVPTWDVVCRSIIDLMTPTQNTKP